MSIKNTKSSYGWLSIVLHWVMAVALIVMFFSGDYMVELDYYDTLYHTLPDIHKSAGIILAILFVFRLVWNKTQQKPDSTNPGGSKIEHFLANMTHWALYLLIALMIVSGYLISTAKGAGVEVFDLFKVPALLAEDADRGELAGDLHEIFGTAFISLVAMHAAAAVYHHFILKNNTLKRMLNIKGN